MNWYERDTIDDSVGLDLTGDNTVRHWSQLPPAPIYPRLFDLPAEMEPAATTDLQELRDPTPAVARGHEPDATVPELRSSRRSAALRDKATELNTTLKLDEDDLFEVREVDPASRAARGAAAEASGCDWELPINPGIRAVRTIAKVALPVVLVASLTLVLTPPERTSAIKAIKANKTPAPAGRLIAFGTLQRLPATAEPPAPRRVAAHDLPTATETSSGVVAAPPVARGVAKTTPPPRQKQQVRRRRPRRSPRVIQPTARQLRRYKRALSSARRALRRQHWAKARARAAAALDILPRDRRARAIKRLAERKLRGGRRYL